MGDREQLGIGNGGVQSSLGETGLRQFVVVETTNLGSDGTAVLVDELTNRGLHTVHAPADWSALLGRLTVTRPERAPGDPLAKQEDLQDFFNSTEELGRRAGREASLVWGALRRQFEITTPEYVATQRSSSIANPKKLAELEATLRLFVIDDDQQALLDTKVLEELILLALQTRDVNLRHLGIQHLAGSRTRLLAMFVNTHLGLTGQNALPVDPASYGIVESISKRRR